MDGAGLGGELLLFLARYLAVPVPRLTIGDEMMDKAEVIKKFGVDPDCIGNRPRGWWVIETEEQIESEEEYGNAKVGDLVVKTRDGGSNPIDPDAFRMGSCVGS